MLSRAVLPTRTFGVSLSRSFASLKASKVIKPRAIIVFNDAPHRVGKITQGKRGKGGGFVKAGLKNMLNGTQSQHTFTSDETVIIADMEKLECIYSYLDGEDAVFMNSETFEEIRVKSDLIDNFDFIVEGSSVKLQLFNKDVIVGVLIPEVCEYEVVDVDITKSSSGNQPATLKDCKAVVMVPEFIKPEQRIKINTLTQEFVSKVSD